MSTDIENQTMELLTATVEDEKKNVTYRWLSRSMGYSVNTAKQFMETYLSTIGKGKVHGTYYLARQDPHTGNQVISLISQDNLHAAINDTAVVGYHIYSLEPSPLKDLSILSVANLEANRLQQGKDVNIFRVVHNKDVVISKSNNRASAPPPKPTSAQASKPAAAPTAPTAPTAATSSTSSSATTSSNVKSKPGSTATKASVMSFFGKAATTAPKAVNTTPATASPTPPAKSSKLNFKPVVQKRKADSMMSTNNNNLSRSSSREVVTEVDSDEEVDSEEERDRRLALSSLLDQDQGDVVGFKDSDHKVASPAASTALDVNAIKKRQRSARLLAVDDDDEDEGDHFVTQKPTADDGNNGEDDEESVETMSKEDRVALNKEKERQLVALKNMMLAPDEDSPMIDVEALESPSEPPVPASGSSAGHTQEGAAPRRRRGVRAVTKRKTSRNERGYMVTEDIVEMESFSEDEDIPAPAPAPIRTEKVEAVKTKSETGGAKKKAGTGNQSLLNFFSKK